MAVSRKWGDENPKKALEKEIARAKRCHTSGGRHPSRRRPFSVESPSWGADHKGWARGEGPPRGNEPGGVGGAALGPTSYTWRRA